MLKKIIGNSDFGNRFIKVFYPGLAISGTDSGIASIARIDRIYFKGNKIIKMHPHKNDEILTYLRSGYAEHLDSEGYVEKLDNTKLMLMKAGDSFYHEERIIDKGEPFEGLQIFIRPKLKDLIPSVSFLELKNAFSINQWRLLASPNEETDLQFSSQTWIYDIKINNNKTFTLPYLRQKSLTSLLYVFKGKIMVNNDIVLSKKDSLIIKREVICIISQELTELVLLVSDETAEYYDKGMFSGNLFYEDLY